MSRDFTYVDDIVEGLRRIILRERPPQEGVPARIYNIGAGRPSSLLDSWKPSNATSGRRPKKNLWACRLVT
jgi:UDP-glucuronate 4-epimerase